MFGLNGTPKSEDDEQITHTIPSTSDYKYDYSDSSVYVDFEKPNKLFYPVIPVSDMDKEPHV